ncbi:nucleoid-associated protein YgaU [Yoonia maricola]|uniref:Nucleoid-associated protein YgaU n=1 Tax=Yoonia maricola TaxID=420999 RepID=A0A2M8WMR8_9RHOB|nr:LysM peptidoglycan-binding domain-containing protein [Yoonia maricola]PJI92220.1 nucleoid-associated protein YgaU [Yoonia maricola]
MTEEAKSGAKPVVLGGIAAAVIGLVIFVLMPQPDIADAPVAAGDDAAAETTIEADDTTEVAAEVPEPQAPAFDTFRVETDGSIVIAGRALPGQTVDVMLAGAAIDRVQADGSGSFVSLPVAGPSDQPRRLSLLADPEGAAVASTTSYIVAPIAAPAVVAAAPAPEEPTDTPVGDAPEAPSAPVVDAPVAAPAPPTVLQADAGGIRVVQGAPTLESPQVDANVALDAITYDPEGEVQLSGRATGDGAVQVYIDNEPLTASPVTEGGDWRIDLPDIDTGVYTLRIDEVDTAGDVVSRLETPFKREEPDDVAAVLAEETSVEGFEVAVRTVQPGATLWAIAEENLGNGIFFVEVFEANSDLIRDPDLIYPGQIFRMPEITQ